MKCLRGFQERYWPISIRVALQSICCGAMTATVVRRGIIFSVVALAALGWRNCVLHAGPPVVEPQQESGVPSKTDRALSSDTWPQQDEGTSDYFVFAALGDQGVVSPRRGKLWLTVTDISLSTGNGLLEVRRRFEPNSPQPRLLGKGWVTNWESRLERIGKTVIVEDFLGLHIFPPADQGKPFVAPDGSIVELEEASAVHRRPDGTQEFFDVTGRLKLRVLPNGQEFVLKYSPADQLVSVEGPNGAGVRLTRDSTGHVARIRSMNNDIVEYRYQDDKLNEVRPLGRGVVRYRYNSAGQLEGIEHPAFGRVFYEYDDAGRVLARERADGTRESWFYDDSAREIRHTNALGALTILRMTEDGQTEEWTNALGQTTTLTYTESGQVQQVTGPSGRTLTATYDSQSRMTSLATEEVGSVHFSYDGSHRTPTSMKDVAGQTSHFRKDASGRAMEVGGEKNSQMSLDYDAGGSLNRVFSCDGREVLMTYDNHGRVASVSSGQGRVTQFEYDSAGNLVRESDPTGQVTSRTWDAAGRLTGVRTADGALTQYRYSPGGLLTAIIDPNGAATRYRYLGRVIEIRDPADRVVRQTYDAAGRLEIVTDGSGNKTQLTYDGAGNLIRTVNPAEGTTDYRYDVLGNLVEMTDPAGGVTRYEYSPTGQLTRLMEPTGISAEMEYSANGQLVSITRSSGHEIRYEYDASGRLIAQKGSARGETHYEYTDCGQLTRIIPPAGPGTELSYNEFGSIRRQIVGEVITEREYDEHGWLTGEKHSSGLDVQRQFDANGALLKRQDSLGRDDRMRYDSVGRLVEFEDFSGSVTRFRYDLAGNLISRTNPLQQVTRFLYTATGDLAEVIAPSGDRASFEYAPSGQLSAIQQPSGGRSAFAYDALGNLRQTTDPAGNSTIYEYDKAGRLIATTDADDRRISYAWDAAGRLIQKRLPDGNIVTYRYDASGRLSEIDDGVFPVRYTYDNRGNTTRIDYPSIEKTLAYEYDNLDRVIRFQCSDAAPLRYSYDDQSRLAAIEIRDGQKITMTWDERDRIVSVIYPNDIRGTWTYDGNGRVREISWMDSAGKLVSLQHYTLDAAGNPIEIRDAAGKTRQFQYDAVGQLMQEVEQDRTDRYTLLPGGNRKSRTSGDDTVHYQYDIGNRLVAAGKDSFRYNKSGQLIEREGPEGTTRFAWNAEGQLTEVTLSSGESIAFGYSPTGERIWREDASGRTWFLTDGTYLLSELDGSLQTQTRFIYGAGIDQPLAMAAGDGIYFYHADAVGTIKVLTDVAGDTAATYETDAFGRLIATTGQVKNPLIYTAREFDAELGLYYYRARYYDPEHGRFLSMDPAPIQMERPLSLNPYLYAWNNPTRFRDPWGTAPYDELTPEQIAMLRREVAHYRTQSLTDATAGLRNGIDYGRLILRDWYWENFEDPNQILNRNLNVERARIAVYETELARQQLLGSNLTAQPPRPGVPQGGLSSSIYTSRSGTSTPPAAVAGGRGMPRSPSLAVTGIAPRPGAQVTRIGASGISPNAPSSALPPRPKTMIPTPPGSGLQGLSSSIYSPGILESHAGKISVGTIIATTLVCVGEGRGGAECGMSIIYGAAIGSAINIGSAVVGQGVSWSTGGAVGAVTASATVGAVVAGGLGIYSIGNALGEGLDTWRAENEARRNEQLANFGGRLLNNYWHDEFMPALQKQYAELVRRAADIERGSDVSDRIENAKNALTTARDALAAGQVLVAQHKDLIAEAQQSEQSANLLETMADKVVTDAHAVIAQLDTLDASVANTDSEAARKKMVQGYQEAGKTVIGLTTKLNEIRTSNRRMAGWRELLRAMRVGLANNDGAAVLAQQIRQVTSIREQVANSIQDLKTRTQQFEADKQMLLGRISRLHTAVPPLSSSGASLDDLRNRVQAVVPQMRNMSHAEFAIELELIHLTELQGKAGELRATAATVASLKVHTADAAIQRAEDALQNARERLLKSGQFDDNVATATPQMPTEGRHEKDPFGEGFGVIPRTGAGDSGVFGQGGQNGMKPQSSDPFGEGFGVADIPTVPTDDGDRGSGSGGGTSSEENPVQPSQQGEGMERTDDTRQPLYAVYGVHTCRMPEIKDQIARLVQQRASKELNLNAILKWIDGLNDINQYATPSVTPTGYLVFQVTGEILDEYLEHQKKEEAGMVDNPYWLFVAGARYHQNYKITQQAPPSPMFLTFIRLVEGGVPEQYLGTPVGFYESNLQATGIGTLSQRSSPGSGLRVSDTDGKLSLTSGSIAYDLDDRWEKQTRENALKNLKATMRLVAPTAVEFGSSFGF